MCETDTIPTLSSPYACPESALANDHAVLIPSRRKDGVFRTAFGPAAWPTEASTVTPPSIAALTTSCTVSQQSTVKTPFV